MTKHKSAIDPTGLQEFSVVFTDRSLNHMSQKFQAVMTSISSTLKEVYNASSVALVPGGGTYAMEAVARQFARDQDVLVIRNGWFSYRWSQIFESCQITPSAHVMKAKTQTDAPQAPFAPASLEEVLEQIKTAKPKVVFAPHVETAAGMILPDGYIKAVADAVHAEGGIFVLDCIASGCIWVDMQELGVDVLISAPQKGWSGTPCAGFVMMNATSRAMLDDTQADSFAINLKTWSNIMEAYENGGHAYHATMPTDGLVMVSETMDEMRAIGFDKLKSLQTELGQKVRDLFAAKGYVSVATQGYDAPGVVVVYTDDPNLKNGSKFAANGVQIAAGVPLQCDEPADYSTFRIGLFGLDKLNDIDGAVARLGTALDAVTEPAALSA